MAVFLRYIRNGKRIMIAKENLELGIFVQNLQGEIFQINHISDSRETVFGIDVSGNNIQLNLANISITHNTELIDKYLELRPNNGIDSATFF